VGLGLVTGPVPSAAVPGLFVHDLLTGTAWYHLYFLLVSMQFYLLFPLLRAVLQATRGRHGLLLAASAALQVVIDLAVHGPGPAGTGPAPLPYATSLLTSYQFFLVLGGVLAMHLDEADAWVRRHPLLVAAGPVVTGTAVECWYRWSVTDGASPQFAADVFQPILIPWSVTVVAALWALGTAWADRRHRWRRAREVVEAGAARSFGVFLVHPAILWLLTTGPHAPAALLPRPWATVLVYPVAVVGSLAVVEVLRHTPISVALTGKPRSRPRPAAPPAAAPSTNAVLAATTGDASGG
jgi:surface polysaccharide O-acyltransferase-like enzyme